MTATVASSAAILKTKYTQPKVFWEAYEDNPSFAGVRKDTTFDGNNKVIAIQTEGPIGGGFSIGQAQANLGPGLYKNYLLTRIEDFGVARIKGQALKAAAKSTGALLDLWTREMDGIILHVTRSAAINMWRTGTGSRGVISTGSTVASTKITLATIQDVSNFYVGMQVQASATDGGVTRGGGTYAVITKVNRVTGDLTSATNWSAQIGGLSTGDYLGRNGDLVTGLTLELVMKRGAGTPFYPAEHVLKYAELLIGGQRIDHLTGTWLRLYDELLRPVDSRSAHEAMTNFCTPAGTTQGGTPVGGVKRFYLSLPFWFCRGDRGAALPLIALPVIVRFPPNLKKSPPP